MNKLKEYIIKLIQEYTGTGASGGNATDGNDIPSQRIRFDDEADEMEFYTNQNVYGGDGGHYTADMYTGNYPNRHKMPMFEEEDEEILIDFIKNELRKYYGVHDTFGASPRQRRNLSGLPGVLESPSVSEQLSSADMAGFQRRRIKNQKDALDIERDQASATLASQGSQFDQQQIQLGTQQQQNQETINQLRVDIPKKKRELRTLKQELIDLKDNEDLPIGQKEEFEKELTTKIEAEEKAIDDLVNQRKQALDQKNQLSNQSVQINKAKGDASSALKQQISNLDKQIRQVGTGQGGSPPAPVSEYFKDENSNLMDRIDIYRKEAKRAILMEGAMKRFFKMFDEGRTNEEIIKMYERRGIVVPEQFISKARKKHEGLKHDKLDLEELEREVKDFKKVPLVDENDIEEKQLASKLFEK